MTRLLLVAAALVMWLAAGVLPGAGADGLYQRLYDHKNNRYDVNGG